jgi:hypothetical protein
MESKRDPLGSTSPFLALISFLFLDYPKRPNVISDNDVGIDSANKECS